MRDVSSRDEHFQIIQRPQNPTAVPLQVQWTDVIVLNDALGETFYFSANLVDSFEVKLSYVT